MKYLANCLRLILFSCVCSWNFFVKFSSSEISEKDTSEATLPKQYQRESLDSPVKSSRQRRARVLYSDEEDEVPEASPMKLKKRKFCDVKDVQEHCSSIVKSPVNSGAAEEEDKKEEVLHQE